MKKQSKTFIFILFFIINLFLTNKIFAATLELAPSKKSLGVGEQFYIDVMLDTKGQSINTIKGSISFPDDYVSFVRAEDGKSMVNLWVEKPKQDDNTIIFAGIISNGFDGVIDPFNPKYKLPGLILRLVFESKKPGMANFSTLPFSLNLNDGLGTEIVTLPVYKSLTIDNFVYHYKYEDKKEGIPNLEAYVTKDPNIFDNKYTLVFNAIDKETGIKSVLIKEGSRSWKEVESPYKLLDQSRHSKISLQATSFSGSSVVINIDKIPYDKKMLIQLFVIILLPIIFSVILIKKYVIKK